MEPRGGDYPARGSAVDARRARALGGRGARACSELQGWSPGSCSELKGGGTQCGLRRVKVVGVCPARVERASRDLKKSDGATGAVSHTTYILE